ncbi:MAG: hypothetical protein ACREQY_12970 [Candidatus Binatia bacterium]
MDEGLGVIVEGIAAIKEDPDKWVRSARPRPPRTFLPLRPRLGVT